MVRLDRIRGICERDLDERSLRQAVLAELRLGIPFDAYAWLLTDPETNVGSAPLAEIPKLGELPAVVRAKYLAPTNRWTGLPTERAAALMSTLARTSDAERTRSGGWLDVLARNEIDDVASIVFRDRHGCWGFLDLWRRGGHFGTAEVDDLGATAALVTPALRRRLAAAFEPRRTHAGQPPGPAVLLLSDDLRLVTQTAETDAWLRALLPTDAARSPVPAGALNVAAQLLAREAGVDPGPPSARVHLGDGRWVTLRAARLPSSSPPAGAQIAVTIEPTPATERSALYGRVLGLTPREAELLGHLATGDDTRALAGRMYLSAHTVQDHLKAVFAKAGVNSRRALVARATGASAPSDV